MEHPTSSVPCVVAGDWFLYAQKNSVACCTQTLDLKRYVTRHKEAVSILAADVDGTMVVSCDRTMAIVWDPTTGEEKGRLEIPEPLATVVWAKNEIVAFGSRAGNIIFFNPRTGESSVCELALREEITALAPARTGDHAVYAVGYKNGSVLVYRMRPNARPRPQAEWLHNLSASSPIQCMSWHASSPLLAVQDADGVLRIWNIKDEATERVVAQHRERSLGWMGWSKHGRIVHYQTGNGNVWDVSGKVPRSCRIDDVPDDIVGMAFCGPRATFFILRTDNTLQKYALSDDPSRPPAMIAEQTHPLVSTILPVSVEDRDTVSTLFAVRPSRLSFISATSEVSEITIMKGWQSDSDGSDDDTSRSFVPTQLSGLPRACATTRPSSQETSISTCTWISAGSSPPRSVPNSFLPGMHGLLSSFSAVEPQKDIVADLFPGARRRVIRTRSPLDPPQLAATLPQFQAQILAVVFGWEDSVQDLVRDEIACAAKGEPRRELLAKWLSSAAPSAGLQGKTQNTKKCAETDIQNGNIHGAVCTLLQVHLYDQAVALYENSGRYMEAMLVAFLYVPRREYQVHLMGAWACAEEHSSPQLARRCRVFATEAAQPPTRLDNVPQHGPRRVVTNIQPLHLSTSCADTTAAALSANPRTAIPLGVRALGKKEAAQIIPRSAHPDTCADRTGTLGALQSGKTPMLLSPIAYQRDGTLPERGRHLIGKWREGIRSISAKRPVNVSQTPNSGVETQNDNFI